MNEVIKVEQGTMLTDEELNRVNGLLNSALLELSCFISCAEIGEDDFELLMIVWESIVESTGILLSHSHPRCYENQCILRQDSKNLQ